MSEISKEVVGANTPLSEAEVNQVMDSAAKIMSICLNVQTNELVREREVSKTIKDLAEATYNANPSDIKKIIFGLLPINIQKLNDDIVKQICLEKLESVYSLAVMYKITSANY